MGVFCWTVCASVGSFPRVFTLIAKLLTGRIGLFKTELYKSCAASRSESEECGSGLLLLLTKSSRVLLAKAVSTSRCSGASGASSALPLCQVQTQRQKQVILHPHWLCMPQLSCRQQDT